MVRRKVVMSRDPKLPLCQWSEASNRKVNMIISVSTKRNSQTVEKPLFLGRVAFLAPFGRSQRSRKMLRHKALGLCPKPRQGDDPPAPRTLSAA